MFYEKLLWILSSDTKSATQKRNETFSIMLSNAEGLMVEGIGGTFDFILSEPVSQCSGLIQGLEIFLNNRKCLIHGRDPLAGMLELGIPTLEAWKRERRW